MSSVERYFCYIFNFECPFNRGSTVCLYIYVSTCTCMLHQWSQHGAFTPLYVTSAHFICVHVHLWIQSQLRFVTHPVHTVYVCTYVCMYLIVVILRCLPTLQTWFLYRDKNGKRPHDPEYDPRTLLVPREYLKSLTPAMRQWWEIKSSNFDTVLFFKVHMFVCTYVCTVRMYTWWTFTDRNIPYW